MLFNVYFDYNGIFKPYRVAILIIIAYDFLVNKFTNLRFQGPNKLLFLIIIFGILATFGRAIYVNINYTIFFNHLLLFMSIYLMYNILYSLKLDWLVIEKSMLIFNVGLLLNFLFIINNTEVSTRVNGLFSNSNSLALASLFGSIFSLLILFKSKFQYQIFLLSFLAIDIYLLNQTASRINFILLILVLGFYFVTNLQRKSFLFICSFCLISFFFYSEKFNQIGSDTKIKAIERQQLKQQAGHEEFRLELAQAALMAAADSRFLGVGISQFKEANNFAKFMKPFSPEMAKARMKMDEGLVTHSTFLQLLAEYGVIGLLIFLYFLYSVYHRSVKIWIWSSPIHQIPLVILLVFIIYSIVHVTLFNPIFWFFLGLVHNKYFHYQLLLTKMNLASKSS